MEQQKKYEIGGTVYVQRPLVLGQIKQILEATDGMTFHAGLTPLAIIDALADRLPLALAVVLTPEGQPVKGKNLPSLADELENTIELATAIQVVEDFFTCNPTAAVFEKLAGMVKRIRASMATGSGNSSVPSPTETSPSGTQSSGDSLSRTASPT